MHFTANINYNQCDQIRQNVAILAKNSKPQAICVRVFLVLGKT